MKMRCLIPFFQVAVLMLGWVVQPALAGPSVAMASFKNEKVDVSYPEGWNLSEVKGNSVVQAKMFRSGTSGPNITIFCFEGSDLRAHEITNALLSGLRQSISGLHLIISKELEDGSRYEVYEGHFSSKGRKRGMKAIVAFKLEGNKCGYTLLGVALSGEFDPVFADTVSILKSAK